MKFLLIPLVLAAGSAMACPGDSKSKDAMAPAAADKVAVAKTTPTTAPAAAVATPVASRQAAMPAAETRKASTL